MITIRVHITVHAFRYFLVIDLRNWKQKYPFRNPEQSSPPCLLACFLLSCLSCLLACFLLYFLLLTFCFLFAFFSPFYLSFFLTLSLLFYFVLPESLLESLFFFTYTCRPTSLIPYLLSIACMY